MNELKKNKRSFNNNLIFRSVSVIILQLRVFIFLPLISKKLGSSDYGLWTQIGSFILLLSPIITLRLETACIRYMSRLKKKEEISQKFFSVTLIVLFMLGISVILVLLFREGIAKLIFGSSGEIRYIYFLTLYLVSRTLFVFIKGFYRIYNQILKDTIIEVSTFLGAAALSIYFLVNDFGLIYVFISFIVFEMLAFILMTVDILKQIGLPGKLNFKFIRKYLSYSIGLVPNNIFFWVINYSDRLLIIYFLSISSVGIYAASYSIGNIINIFVTPIIYVLFPTITRLWEEKKKKMLNIICQNP